MTPTECRTRRQQLIRQRAELRKKLIDVEADLEICELDAAHDLLLATANRTPPGSETGSFIERNRHLLEPDDIEFLEQETRGLAEVAAYMQRSESSVRREIKSGKLPAARDGLGPWRIQTVPVVERLIHGKTQEAS